MFDDLADCKTLDEEMRQHWLSGRWYVRRIEKRLKWFTELRARDEQKIAELEQTIVKLRLQIESWRRGEE